MEVIIALTIGTVGLFMIINNYRLSQMEKKINEQQVMINKLKEKVQ